MIRINLLPKEEKPSKEARTWNSIFIWSLIAAGIVIIAGVGFHIFHRYEIDAMRSDTAAMKAEQDQYRSQAAIVNDLTQKRKLIAQRLDIIETLDANRSARVRLLDEIARSVPDYVWLTSMEETANVLTVKGVAFSNLAISQFMDLLEGKDHIGEVELRIIRRDDIDGQPVLTFEIACGLTIATVKSTSGEVTES
jgi:type IV pilus assembly protein PilN